MGRPLKKSIHRFTALVTATALLASGCVTTRQYEVPLSPRAAAAHLSDVPEGMRDHYYILKTQGQRNLVLNSMRLGLASMHMGDRQRAASLFDQALQGIETVYADNEAAKEARSLWAAESVKDFKGEPYERAMAYYYRGLLYLYEGDYENARASFKGGLLQDAFAEEEQYRADFALLMALEGWSSRCLGDAGKAAESFKEFKSLREEVTLPSDKDNTLIILESGGAPEKYGIGDDKSANPRFLKFQESYVGRNSKPRTLIPAAKEAGIDQADGQKTGKTNQSTAFLKAKPTELWEDIHFQASTRGGRPVDHVIAGKVAFQETTAAVGSAMVTTGAVAGVAAASYASRPRYNNNRNRDDDRAAAAVMAVAAVLIVGGLVAQSVAASVETAADARYWDNLPWKVYGQFARIPEGTKAINVYFENTPQTDEVMQERIEIVRRGKCGIAWGRSISASTIPPRAPNSVPQEVMAQAISIPIHVPGTETNAIDKDKECPAEQEAAIDYKEMLNKVGSWFVTGSSEVSKLDPDPCEKEKK